MLVLDPMFEDQAWDSIFGFVFDLGFYLLFDLGFYLLFDLDFGFCFLISYFCSPILIQGK